MPPSLFDHLGRQVSLGPSVGKGGEAEVFELADARVAKLYHKPPDAAKIAKLGYMVGANTPDLAKVAAWPVTTLHDRPQGQLRGFVMPRMIGFKPLHLLYGPISRRREFPDRNWDFLIQVAMNCAAAFDTVHAAGTVIGDVNANNLMASSRDATVRLIDCDSFQFRANGKSFLCEVGVPEYTPPELQEKPFAGVLRTANHDFFGLAVLTFQLLFMGRHPFFGRYLGKGDMPQERAIKELRFAFGRLAAAKQMSAPPHVLPFASLPAGVTDLFERAFADGAIRGGRPSSVEWLKGLASLKSQLATCAVDPSHKFPAQAAACPWCAIAAHGGPIFFISAQLALDFTCAPGDLDRLLTELQKLLGPRSEPQLQISSSAPAPAPLSQVAQAARSRAPVAYLVFGSSLAAFGAAGTWAVLASSTGALVSTIVGAALTGISLIWLTWLQNWSALGVERRARVAELSASETQYRETLSKREYQTARFRETAARCQQQAEQLRRSYVSLLGEYNTELAALTHNSEVANRRAYLEAQEIADAKIEKIGPAKKKNLISCGIETAYDIIHSDLTGVPGIGPTLQARLVAWARSVESRFRFDPAKGLPEGDRRALVGRYRHRQISVRGDLETLVSQSRSGSGQYDTAQKQFVQEAAAAERRLREAQANVALVPRRASWPVVGGLLLVAAWLGGTALYRRQNPRTDPSVVAVSEAEHRDAGIASVPDDFHEGLELLQAGSGVARQLRFQPHDGQKQRAELTMEATLSDGHGVGRLPRTTVQALITAHKGQADSFDYAVVLESLRVSDTGQLDPSDQALKKDVGKLAGSSITITIAPDGTVLATRVDKVTQSGPMFELVIEQMQLAVSYLAMQVPDAKLASGARWRIRRERIGQLPFREDSMTDAQTITQISFALERSTKFSSIPVGRQLDAGATGVDGTLNVHFELKSNDIVPTVAGTYDISADLVTKDGAIKARQHEKVSIHPM